MRKTIFAKDMDTMRERLFENLYNGWKQVSEIHVKGTRYQVEVEKEKTK